MPKRNPRERGSEEFAQRLREAMSRPGTEMSPEELARRLRQLRHLRDGVRSRAGTKLGRPSCDRVYKWLNGDAIPDPSNAQLLGQALNVPPDWLRYGLSANAPAPHWDHRAIFEIIDQLANGDPDTEPDGLLEEVNPEGLEGNPSLQSLRAKRTKRDDPDTFVRSVVRRVDPDEVIARIITQRRQPVDQAGEQVQPKRWPNVDRNPSASATTAAILRNLFSDSTSPVKCHLPVGGVLLLAWLVDEFITRMPSDVVKSLGLSHLKACLYSGFFNSSAMPQSVLARCDARTRKGEAQATAEPEDDDARRKECEAAAANMHAVEDEIANFVAHIVDLVARVSDQPNADALANEVFSSRRK